MALNTETKKLSPSYDPWEAYLDIEEYGSLQLTNVEFTTTNLCNMRCGHCAVGYTLQAKDPEALPIELLLKKLDEIPLLRSLSITGGEPMLSTKSVDEYVVPLLKYAHDRGVRTQINSNLTLPYSRYEKIIPYLDVLHISHNWGTSEEFIHHGFAVMDRKPSEDQRLQLFERMIENSKALSKAGVFVSAETMLNKRTLPYLEQIHQQVIDMGCDRHEIHPMYPSDFASNLETISIDDLRQAIHHVLDFREQRIWMLFGTLPFYACNQNQEDLDLLRRLHSEKNVTVRNDPDGRSRLNVNIFTGDIIVTDFGDIPTLGNIKENSLMDAYQKWSQTEVAKALSCHCPSVKCLGPNILVKDMYYKGENFNNRTSQL